MKYLIGIAHLLGAFVFIAQTNSYAQTNCTQIFGGGTTCKTSEKIAIAKQVKNPQSNSFVASLPTSGPYYTADQAITFRITVENKTNNKLNKITITDNLPKYFRYSMGEGKFDKAKNTLTISLESLNGKEKKIYDISGKIASSSELSKLKNGSNCLLNHVSITTGRETAQTNTQYCLDVPSTPSLLDSQTSQPATPTETKGGQTVYAPVNTQKSPATGAGAISLFSLTLAGLSGIFIRRKMC